MKTLRMSIAVAAAGGAWAGGALAQNLPAWKIAEICVIARDSAPGYCAAGEAVALRAVSGSWEFIPDAIKQSCLAAVKTPADQSWRVLGDCLDGASNRSIDAVAVKTSRTPGEPVPPMRMTIPAPAPAAPVAAAVVAPPPVPAPPPVVVAPPPPVVIVTPPPVAGPPTAPPPVFERLAADAALQRKLADAADAQRTADAVEAKRKAEAELAARKAIEDAAAAARAAKALADAKICTDDIRKFAKDGTIRFATGSARLDPASEPTLTGIAEVAKLCPNVLLQVEGHTDSVGDPQANRALSQARAETIVASLVRAGIAAGRLKATGFGDSRPVAANDSPANRALNRRIEFSVGGT